MKNTPLALVPPAQAAIEKAANAAAQPIYVTQPALPPLHEFIPYLEAIWANKILTNGGPFHQQLERALCDYLGVEHLAHFANRVRSSFPWDTARDARLSFKCAIKQDSIRN